MQILETHKIHQYQNIMLTKSCLPHVQQTAMKDELHHQNTAILTHPQEQALVRCLPTQLFQVNLWQI